MRLRRGSVESLTIPRVTRRALNCSGSGVRPLHTLLLTALVAAGAATPATAQVVPPTFEDMRAEAHRGETVYLTDQAGTTVKGRVVRISTASIELLVDEGSREWQAANVAWITQRHRHAGRGALLGLAVGAAVGAMMVLADNSCTHSCAADDAGFMLIFSGLFAGLGGGIGAAVGAATHSERVLYAPAPVAAATHTLTPFAGRGTIGVRAQLRF